MKKVTEESDTQSQEILQVDLSGSGQLSPVTEHAIVEMEAPDIAMEDVQFILRGLRDSVVHIAHLHGSLTTAVEIIVSNWEGRNRPGVGLLLRNGMIGSFRFLLQCESYLDWPLRRHQDVVACFQVNIDLAVYMVQKVISYSDPLKEERSLVAVLQSVEESIDWSCKFHDIHKFEPMSSLPNLQAPLLVAAPLTIRQEECVSQWKCLRTKSVVKSSGSCSCRNCQPKTMYAWLVFLVLYLTRTRFGDGFTFFMAALLHPGTIHVDVVMAILRIFGKAADFLTEQSIIMLQGPYRTILRFILSSLDTNLHGYSKEEANNRLLNLVVAARPVIVKMKASGHADMNLSFIHRQIVGKLIRSSTMNAQFTALKELNAVFHGRVNDRILQETLSWILENDVTKLLFGSFLHLEQFVGEISALLTSMAVHGRLPDDVLELSWQQALSIDQYEIVKDHLFSLLGNLSTYLTPEQGHLLLSWIEACQPAEDDAAMIIDLTMKISVASSDKIIVKRCLNQLWGTITSVSEDSEAHRRTFGAFVHIAMRSIDIDPSIAASLIGECICFIEEGRSVLRFLPLLRGMVEGLGKKGGGLDAIKEKASPRRLVDLALKSLMAYKVKGGSAQPRNDSEEKSFVDWEASISQHLMDRLSFLVWALVRGNLALTWEETKLLWDSLMRNSDTDAQVKDALFKWFRESFAFFTPEAQVGLLSSLSSDLNEVSMPVWRCFYSLFEAVNVHSKKLIRRRKALIRKALDLSGLDFIWESVFKSQDAEVSMQSVNLLCDLHINLDKKFEGSTAEVHECFLLKVTGSFNVLHQSASDGCPLLLRCLDLLQTYINRSGRALHSGPDGFCQLYPILHTLLDSQVEAVSEASYKALTQLPKYPLLVDTLMNVDSGDHLSRFLGSAPSTAYKMEIVADALTAATTHFRPAFMEASGIESLLRLLQAGNYPSSISHRLQVECCRSMVKIFNNILFGPMPGDQTQGSPSHTASEETPQSPHSSISKRPRIQTVSEVPTEEDEPSPSHIPAVPGSASSCPHSERAESPQPPMAPSSSQPGRSSDSSPSPHSLQEVGTGAASPPHHSEVSPHIQQQQQQSSQLAGSTVARIVDALTRLCWCSALSTLPMMNDPNLLSGSLHYKLSQNEMCSQRWGDDYDMVDSYASLTRDCLALLEKCLGSSSALLDDCFVSCWFHHFVTDILLHCPSRQTREDMASTLIRLCKKSTSTLDLPTLLYLKLLDLKDAVEGQSMAGSEFWSLMAKLVPLVTWDGLEGEMDAEIEWLTLYSPLGASADISIEGHLLYLKELSLRLSAQERDLTHRRSSLVAMLVKDCLFPEAAYFQKLQGGGRELGGCGIDIEEAMQVRPKCAASSSRAAAFALLLELAREDLANAQLVMELQESLHPAEDIQRDANLFAEYESRGKGLNVGLKNAGVTCYMNSVLQQLYLHARIRRGILQCTTPSEDERPHSILYQLQTIFGNLLASELAYYSPAGFWAAYGRSMESFSLHRQEDATEFFGSLGNKLDDLLRAAGMPPIFSDTFGGEMVNQIISKDCPHRSGRVDPFQSVHLEVRGKGSIEEALELLTKPELLSGSNAYKCEACLGKMVSAKRQSRFSKLPGTLVLTLKRQVENFFGEVDSFDRIGDRVSFPGELDMAPFMKEEEEEQEGEGSPQQQGESGGESPAADSKSPLLYRLAGVVVHVGGTSSGHYYSMAVDRCTRQWMKYNDQEVSQYDPMDLGRDSYGGRGEGGPCAYMLLYDRVEEDRPYEHHFVAPVEEESSFQGRCSRQHGEVQFPIPPTIHRDVLENNIRFRRQKRVVEQEFTAFKNKLRALGDV